MRVQVSPEKCQGHGMCAALVPEVFEINEDSALNEMGEIELPEELRAAVRRGVSACPERAIAIVDAQS